jgi:hypothetical protein
MLTSTSSAALKSTLACHESLLRKFVIKSQVVELKFLRIKVMHSQPQGKNSREWKGVL